SEAMLKSAATVQIIAPQTFSDTRPNLVRIRVTNIGAGHRLPTGFPEGREMWLDFKVVDSRNREVYRLGGIKNGRTEPGTRSFKVTLGDRNGRAVDLNVLEADRILSDTRIEPHGVGEVTYELNVPKRAVAPLWLVANLNYWSFPQALFDE